MAQASDDSSSTDSLMLQRFDVGKAGGGDGDGD